MCTENKCTSIVAAALLIRHLVHAQVLCVTLHLLSVHVQCLRDLTMPPS